MELSPNEVRDLVLADHAALRVRLGLLRRAVAVADERGDSGALLEMLPGLLDHLSAHLDLEDQILAPTLRTIDAWGPEREQRLSAEHAEQRAWIADCRAQLAVVGGDLESVSAQALMMIGRIEQDMDQEEAHVLDPKLMTDEIIYVDFGG